MLNYFSDFFFLPENRFDISCILFPKETICMKCQLFYEKNMKNIINLWSAEFTDSILSIKTTDSQSHT